MAGPISVEGPDGQKYEFPEGTAPETMKEAMGRRYPKSVQAPEAGYAVAPSDDNPLGITYDEQRGMSASTQPPLASYNDRVKGLLSDPQHWKDSAAAAISGINNVAYLGADDNIAGFLGEKTGLQPLKNYEATQDRLRAEQPTMYQAGQMATSFVPTGVAVQAQRAPSILKSAATGGAVNAAIGLPLGYNDADGEGQDRVAAGRDMAAFSGGFGALLGGGGTTMQKLFGPSEFKAIRAELEAIADRPLRPQSLKAFRRVLSHSGMSDDAILALNREVNNRIEASQSGTAAGRKRTFQHYIETLAEDPASPFYNPQAAANIQMVVQERANSAVRGDASGSIVGRAVEADRASQVPFLEDSARKLSNDSRISVQEQVAQTRNELGQLYSQALSKGPATPKSARGIMRVIADARPLMDGPSGLKVQAAVEGMKLHALIKKNPLEAAHWMQAAARRKSQSSDANAVTYGRLRQRFVDAIENASPEYRSIRQRYGTNEQAESAVEFGDKLFGGAQSNLMNNPGLRAKMVQDFNQLPEQQQRIALMSIRDQALGRLQGGQQGNQARTTQLNTMAALDFLEEIGQKGFADDIRAIARENQLLNVADAGNPLRQSATFSNAKARTDAPPLYEGRIANAVNNSTPGTVMGEGMLMAFAPHYQGMYAAYRGSRLAARAGFGTRKKTLEDLTRFLMSRKADSATNNAPPAPTMRNALAVPPSQVPEAVKASGLPINALARPGVTGAIAGGVTGYATAPEDATMGERFTRAGVGAVAGLGGAKFAQSYKRGLDKSVAANPAQTQVSLKTGTMNDMIAAERFAQQMSDRDFAGMQARAGALTRNDHAALQKKFEGYADEWLRGRGIDPQRTRGALDKAAAGEARTVKNWQAMDNYDPEHPDFEDMDLDELFAPKPKSNGIPGGPVGDALALTAIAANLSPEAEGQEGSNSIALQEATQRVSEFEANVIPALEENLRQLEDPNVSPEQKQTVLQRMGYDLGPTGVDGVIGPRTREAIAQKRGEIRSDIELARQELEAARAKVIDLERRGIYEGSADKPASGYLKQGLQLAGFAGGLYLAGRGRRGAVKKSATAAHKTEGAANALLNPKPVTSAATGPNSLNTRAANMNEFWRMGGAGENVPFKTLQSGVWRPRSKPAEPSKLFPEPKRFRATDAAVITGASAESAVMHGMYNNAAEKLEKVEAEIDQYRREGNNAELKRALDEKKRIESFMVAYKTAERLGQGIALGRGLSAFKQPYVGPRPNVAGAEAERALLLAKSKQP